MEAHFIANKDQIQVDHFNSEGPVQNVLGQKRRSACGLFVPRLHNQLQVSIATQKLQHSIQNKRSGMLIRAVVMIHDNTCPHTAMQNLITTFGWEQFDHPPTAQTYHQVIFICSRILNPSLLAGVSTKTVRSKKPLPCALHSRRHHSTMK